MTVLDVIQRSAEFLTKKGVDSPRLQIELLLAHALKVPRLRLYLEFDRVLTETELDLVRSMVKRRGNREPLQHIVGSTSFCGLEMTVSPEVLIPRPETELLAERGWKFLDTLREAGNTSIKALDFGTGSGCLIITLAAKCGELTGYAIDVSEIALKVAQENAKRHQVLERVRWFCDGGFDSVRREAPFDLIVSNPPYIASDDIAELAPEVRHDPRQALDGGSDGLKFFRYLADEARTLLRANGKLMVEFGDGQETEIVKIFSERGWSVEAVENDYSGRPRIMIAGPVRIEKH